METESLNIAQLIEKNPITRLSKDYQSKLVTKIQNNFTNIQQQMFAASFFLYLNYDCKKDFIIDFDNVWKWLGYARKDPAKRALEKNFIINIEYKVDKPAPQISGAGFESINAKENKNLGGAGLNKETIMLTINTFKKFCLKAGTHKADEVHDYYIKLEELLHETINEETDELRKQLELKNIHNAKLEKQNKKLSQNVFRRFTLKYKPGNCLYFVTGEIPGKFKVGTTGNINHRTSDLNTANPSQLEILELYYTDFNEILEKTIKEIFAKYRIDVNNEWYDMEVIDEIKEFINIQIEIYKKFETNSNINILNEMKEDDILYLPEIQKKCIKCEVVLNLKNFFYIDKNKKIQFDECIECYEKEHGDSKQCSNCNEIKNKNNFVIDRTKKDSLTYDCKKCRYELNNIRKDKNKKINANVGKQCCITCETFQELKFFYKKTLENGNIEYFTQCKDCYCKEHGELKQCFTCEEIKNLSEFGKNSGMTGGLDCYCKVCKKLQRDNTRQEKRNKIDPNKNKKQCISCNEYQNYNMFFKKFLNNDKFEYYDTCRSCYTPDSLQCNTCHVIKESVYFSIDTSKNTGRRSICKMCTNEKARKAKEDKKFK